MRKSFISSAQSEFVSDCYWEPWLTMISVSLSVCFPESSDHSSLASDCLFVFSPQVLSNSFLFWNKLKNHHVSSDSFPPCCCKFSKFWPLILLTNYVCQSWGGDPMGCWAGVGTAGWTLLSPLSSLLSLVISPSQSSLITKPNKCLTKKSYLSHFFWKLD